MDMTAALRFRAAHGEWASVAKEMQDELGNIAYAARIPTEVTARAKDVGEFVRKTIRKGYTDPWTGITDKAGARVIVERASQIDSFKQALVESSRLQIVGEFEDDREAERPEILEFTGVKAQVFSVERGSEFEVEVQIRTKAEDLWASVVSHRMLYKKKHDLPKPLRRRLHLLLALTELFDDEVVRVSEEMKTLQTHTESLLSTAAEAVYLGVHPVATWDGGLSEDILKIVIDSMPDLDADAYAATVRAFGESRGNDLASVLGDYGPSEAQMDPHYVIFEQPEVVLVWERLASAPERFRDTWSHSALPMEWLDTVADVTGEVG